jgi:hypothetical protein
MQPEEKRTASEKLDKLNQAKEQLAKRNRRYERSRKQFSLA